MKRKLDWLLHSKNVEIVFEDEHLLVLNKPANLLVLPDRYNEKLPNLSSILNGELGKVYVVHRIDRETSGVIVFAKTPTAHAKLSSQFEGRDVEKVYQAIVVGTAINDEGCIDAPLAESARQPGVMRVVQKGGKESITDYIVLERFRGYAFVGIRPRTGRTHQIRVHLQSIGVPILADKLYGDGRGFFLSGIKEHYKSEGEEKPLLERTALHAAAIGFSHPATGERLSLTIPMPKDMSSVLKYLRKFRKA